MTEITDTQLAALESDPSTYPCDRPPDHDCTFDLNKGTLRGIIARLRRVERERDDWKQLAEDLKAHADKGAKVDIENHERFQVVCRDNEKLRSDVEYLKRAVLALLGGAAPSTQSIALARAALTETGGEK